MLEARVVVDCVDCVDLGGGTAYWQAFFSVFIGRSTTLTMEVKHPLSFINMNTFQELRLVISEKS